jgi:CheY-like chemotaxis protein
VDALVLDAGAGLDPGDLQEVLPSGPMAQPLPVVLYTAGGAEPAGALRHHAPAGRTADSLDQLLDATALVLHRSAPAMTDRERQAVDAVHGAGRVLDGRKALIVDDDMRNIFALATVLDAHGMVIVSADNGPDAIAIVHSDPSIDIVLMDIMMPEMDGLMTIREIRKLPPGRNLPIIAVTAKAMKGDREKCIEAGAWDYLSKPVDTEHLLAVLRSWLCS